MTLCCISLTLASRIIATVGLSVAILMINIVMSEFFTRSGEQFLNAIQPWSFLGLNWANFLISSNITNSVLVIFGCYFSFLTVSLICSSALAVGTVLRKPILGVPWLYFQIAAISDQLITLIVHLISGFTTEFARQNDWYLPLYGIYFLYSLYTWTVVFATCDQWAVANSRASEDINIHYINHSAYIVPERCSEKSPSYLSQNRILFESVVPPSIPERYGVV